MESVLNDMKSGGLLARRSGYTKDYNSSDIEDISYGSISIRGSSGN